MKGSTFRVKFSQFFSAQQVTALVLSALLRSFQNLLFMLVVIFPTRFVKFYFVLFWFNRLGPVLYRLIGLILSGFMKNVVFMFTSGSHKMLKIFIEIRVKVFHDKFFWLFSAW